MVQESGWRDVIVVTAAQLNTKVPVDAYNTWEMFWNVQKAFRTDPPRMVFFGLTVEHHDTRLWFLSASPSSHRATNDGSMRLWIFGIPDEIQVEPKYSHLLCTLRICDCSVYEMVAKTFDGLPVSQRMLLSLDHILPASQSMMTAANALHRNINTGNIAASSDGHAHPSDFENPVFYDEDHEVGSVKTFTPEFVACEVSLSSYTEVRLDTRSIKMKRLTETPSPFCHNPIHDLESMWRVLVWTILRYSPVQQRHDQQVSKRKSEMYDSLFKAPFTDRHYSLMGRLYFKKLSSFGDADLETWCAIISDYLRAEYTRVEGTMPIAQSAFYDSHVQVLADLRSIYDAVEAANIKTLTEVQASIYIHETA